jgi:hypothetical protein
MGTDPVWFRTDGLGRKIEVFHTHKAGNAASEYAGAFSPPERTVADPEECVRAAVADGATDAVFSGPWARLLVEAYAKKPDDTRDCSALFEG